MSKELLKIVFQDGTPEDKQLSITVYKKENEEGKTRLDIAMASMDIMESRNPDVISNIYFDVVNTLLKIKEALDSGKGYEGVHTLTREEYKEYVTKVLGFNIPEEDNTGEKQ